jgi:mannan endo-1,6-alpha-mannosidase
MMGALVEYWYYTKDDSFVELTKQALLFQVGDEWDYMPRNQTLTEGNDDQGFWGLAVMAAAEYNFPHPDSDQPQWLALAQAVFNTQAPRWDNTDCGGGLRWQIYNWNKGWDYKNSISQGTFFALAARLALFTGNSTYADWAEKSWDWMIALEFIDDNYFVYDGAHIPNNCTEIIPYQFSYNAGVFINGASAMYNYTGDDIWRERLDGLLNGTRVFFTGSERNIMEEVACEPVDRCNIDQQSFKAYLSRWLASTMQWVPDTYDRIMPRIRASALAATKQCSGGDNGRMCGMKWSSGKYDGTTGVGQQMAALEVTLALMIRSRDPILTSDTGGESKGDPNAGGSDIGRTEPPGPDFGPVTASEKAGAAILTASIIGCLIAGIFWLFLDETSDKTPLQQMSGFKTSTAAAFMAFLPAGAAGAAGGAAVLRKRNTGNFQPAQAPEGPNATTSPDASSVEQVDVLAAAPMRVSRIEHRTSARHSRRASNMPLGWPHNPSLRGSVLAEHGSAGGSSSQEKVAETPPNLDASARQSASEELNEKNYRVSDLSDADRPVPPQNAEAGEEAQPTGRVSPLQGDETRPVSRP